MYPVKGSASYKHLRCPVSDVMSQERAEALGENKSNETISNDGEGYVDEDQHDLFMLYLSAELGFKEYVRDEMECILCESHPMRSLNCRDWFRRGMSLYDCNDKGEFFCRDYGFDTKWVKLHAPKQYDFAYIGKSPIVYIPIDVRLSHYAATFGSELRSPDSKVIKFKGRNSKTSCHNRSYTNTLNAKATFCHTSMQMADFYVGSYVPKSHHVQSMFVLGDTEHAMKLSNCNDLDNYPNGKRLLGHLQTLPMLKWKHQSTTSMAAACYHRDLESDNDKVTFFPGHLDKPFVHTVWFIPLGAVSFFTILSVSNCYNINQDHDSIQKFNEWQMTLSDRDSRRVDAFLQEFDVQAKKHMRLDTVVRLIFLNTCGSILSFAANQCYHATITPKKPKGYPRDLFIVHPLDGVS
jgi:hypothetical protein